MPLQMMKAFRKLVVCIALVSVAFVANAFGDIIGGPGFRAPGSGGGGFWIGTYTGLPSGDETTTVAQLIPSYYDYSDLVLQVQMYEDTQGTVNLALAPDDDGSPGTPIATESFTLTSGDYNDPIFTSHCKMLLCRLVPGTG